MASCVATWSGSAARAAPVASVTCKQVFDSAFHAHPLYSVRSLAKPPLVLPQPSPFPSPSTNNDSARPRCQASCGAHVHDPLTPSCKSFCLFPIDGARSYARQLRQTFQKSKRAARLRCEEAPEHGSEAALSNSEAHDSRLSSVFTQERAALGGSGANWPERWDVVGLGQAMVSGFSFECASSCAQSFSSGSCEFMIQFCVELLNVCARHV